MFPSFLSDSYFHRLMGKLDDMDAAHAALEYAHDARLDDLESIAAAHNIRIGALELWRQDRAAPVEYITGGGGLPGIADTVNMIIDRLREREIILQ